MSKANHGVVVVEEDFGKAMKDKIRPAMKKGEIQALPMMIEEDTPLVKDVVIEAIQEATLEEAQEEASTTQEVKVLVIIVVKMVILKVIVESNNMHKA